MFIRHLLIARANNRKNVYTTSPIPPRKLYLWTVYCFHVVRAYENTFHKKSKDERPILLELFPFVILNCFNREFMLTGWPTPTTWSDLILCHGYVDTLNIDMKEICICIDRAFMVRATLPQFYMK